jgi:signal transduction histidine kinase
MEQGKRTLDRSEGGHGIGLALVRHIVELHDGSVAVRSEGVGQGSEFLVQLPTNSCGS